MKHYEQPKNDGQKLFNLQYEYKNGRAAALGELYDLLQEIAYKTINNISNRDKKVQEMTAEERRQKAHDAATYIIEQYLKRPDFEIDDSMTGYLFRRVMREIYGARKCDKMLVFTAKLPERANERRAHEYIVTDTATGTRRTYASADELYLNPIFKGLRKKRLVECIKSGSTWKQYKFEIIEL